MLISGAVTYGKLSKDSNIVGYSFIKGNKEDLIKGDKDNLISANVQIEDTSFSLDGAYLVVDAKLATIISENSLELRDEKISIESFVGKVSTNRGNLLLEGTFKRISSEKIELKNVGETVIMIHQGSISSNRINIPKINFQGNGQLILNNKEIVMDIKGDDIKIKSFDGTFQLKSEKNVFNFSGSVQSLTLDNEGYSLLVGIKS